MFVGISFATQLAKDGVWVAGRVMNVRLITIGMKIMAVIREGRPGTYSRLQQQIEPHDGTENVGMT